MQNIAVIIQARTGSKRLPNKMLKPFINNKSLLEVILGQFIDFKYKVILATSTKKQDDAIEEIAKKKNITFFRGSENNVLRRFIDAAEENNIDIIVRVCADNPFISIDYIYDLIASYKASPAEYISFQTTNQTPSIKTHYGFFAELVELKALKKTTKRTDDSFYQEHVTNYIYENENEFATRFLAIPFKENQKIRLTIDTIEDFKLCQNIYLANSSKKEALIPENLVEFLSKDEEYLTLMHQQINNQKK